MTAAVCTLPLAPDRLSAYLDGVLGADDAERVERHLEGCSSCRAELAGLRRVVRQLERTRRSAPPPLLAEAVARRVALEGTNVGLFDRVERALGRVPLDSNLFLGFAMVLALSGLVLAYAMGIQGRSTRSTAPAEIEGDAAVGAAAQRVAGDHGLQVLQAVIGGRTFDRRGALWVERGAEPTDVQRQVAVGSAPAEELLAGAPRLAELTEGSGGVVLLDDAGESVLIVSPEAPVDP
jgi:Na+-transporting methylmalonyl-CoA/oxaloacetate decarboxylase gamma subunit